MKWSQILHISTMLIGIVGFLALIGAWIARNETFFGRTQQHFFNDAISLILLAILFALGTLIHQNEERKNQK